MNNCKHTWVYSNFMYMTEPAQQDRICKIYGLKECVRVGVLNKEITYDEIIRKFEGETNDN